MPISGSAMSPQHGGNPKPAACAARKSVLACVAAHVLGLCIPPRSLLCLGLGCAARTFAVIIAGAMMKAGSAALSRTVAAAGVSP